MGPLTTRAGTVAVQEHSPKAPPRAVAILPLLTAPGSCLACLGAKLSDLSDPAMGLEVGVGKRAAPDLSQAVLTLMPTAC